MHAKLLKKNDKRIGDFRKHNVRVFGASFHTSDAKYVHTDINILLKWYRKKSKTLHPLVLTAVFHEKFEKIHPFYDGNGRTGRMLANLMLLQAGYPPLVIKNKDRNSYYKTLSAGHKTDLTKMKESHRDIVILFYEQLVKTFEKIFKGWG